MEKVRGIIDNLNNERVATLVEKECKNCKKLERKIKRLEEKCESLQDAIYESWGNDN